MDQILYKTKPKSTERSSSRIQNGFLAFKARTESDDCLDITTSEGEIAAYEEDMQMESVGLNRSFCHETKSKDLSLKLLCKEIEEIFAHDDSILYNIVAEINKSTTKKLCKSESKV